MNTVLLVFSENLFLVIKTVLTSDRRMHVENLKQL